MFPLLGKIAEEGLELMGQEEYINNAYSKTTISVAEFKQLEKQDLAIAPKTVKDIENQRPVMILQNVLN